MLRTRVKAGWFAGLVLCLAASALITIVQCGDLLSARLRPEMGAATHITLRVPYSVAGSLHEHQERTVAAGTVLQASNPGHVAAAAYERARRPPTLSNALGVFIIQGILLLALAAYVRKFGQNRLKLLRAQFGMFTLIVALFCFAKLQLLYTGISEFALPVAAVPLWVAASFDRRTALVVTMVVAFLLSTLLRLDPLFLCTLMIQGAASVLLLLDRKHNRALVLAGGLAGVGAAGMLVAVVLMFESGAAIRADLGAGISSHILGCIAGGLLSGLAAATLRSPAERLMGHVPRERLHDLTDLEQPLLRHMAEHAPGSWEHSRAMANLAEAAASAIGADALLVRVGAYYHDLGKSVRPKFFVENLLHAEPTPHDGLTPHESADVIRAHVVEGVRILREGGIPEPVVEFSYTHHGTQVVEYFWNKCKERGNPDAYSEDDFRYPGMKPQTKETAILMLVDSIEAASRTIDPPERDAFEVMIQRIIFTKLASGQLDECGLNMLDLKTIVTRVAIALVNMHHHRIKYPWQAKQAAQFGVPARAVSDLPVAAVQPIKLEVRH